MTAAPPSDQGATGSAAPPRAVAPTETALGHAGAARFDTAPAAPPPPPYRPHRPAAAGPLPAGPGPTPWPGADAAHALPPAVGGAGPPVCPGPCPEGSAGTPAAGAPAAAGARRRPGAWSRDRGVTAVEFAGWVPLLIIVALAAIQLGVAGYAALQAGSAARAAARTAAQQEIADRYETNGRAALSGFLAEGASFDLSPCGDEATVTANVTVPSVMPFVPDFGSASRTVTMPCD